MKEGEKVNLNIVKIALVVQLLFIAIILFDVMGFKIPVLRESIVFAYLFFIPGIVFLKALEMNVKPLKFFVLSVGVSVSIVTLLSTFGSVVLSTVFEKPISEVPISIILSSFTILIIFFCWHRKNFYLTFLINFPSVIMLLSCFLLLILAIMSKIGEFNILSFILLTVFSLVPAVVLLRKTDERVHPLFIWVMSLSLMIMFGLEWREGLPLGVWNTGGVVKTAGVWDPSYPSPHNSQLFTMIFHPVISILSEIDIEVATKIVDCILFSAIPVIIYIIYKEFLSSDHSFLASSLYIFYPFYLQLAEMNRAGFSFLFVSLFLLLIVSDEVDLKKRLPLLEIFAFSLIASHYGTAYMFMFLLIPLILLYLLERKLRCFKGEFIYPNFIVLFIAMAFSWYMYTSGSQSFSWGVDFGYHIITNLEDFFNPQESTSLHAFTTRSVTPSFSLETTKWLLFTLLIFIMIGASNLLFLYLKRKINVKYAILTLSFSTVLIGITQMGLPRILGFSLLLSGPLAIHGLSKILNLANVREDKSLLVFSLFLLLLFAFNYGIVANSINAVCGEVRDMSLQGTFKENVLKSDNLELKRFIYWGWQPSSTLKASDWLIMRQDPHYKIFVDWLVTDSPILKPFYPNEYGGKIICNITQPKLTNIKIALEGDVSGYIFLADHNINHNFIYIVDENREGKYYKTSNYTSIFERMNKIYDNGGGLVLEAGPT